MKRKYSQWLKGGLLGLLAIFGMASCSDDHFDISPTNAQGTLWENMKSTQLCDSFAMILEKTVVNKKEYGTPATLTYASLLNSSRVLTVWAPKDGTYNAAKWLEMLDPAKYSADTLIKNNQIVESQFVQNHLAYFNYNGSYPEVKRIMLANKKYVNYDYASPVNTFNNVNIDAQYKNVASANGTLHVLDASSTFAPNLRELLSLDPNLSEFFNYIESRDTVEFRESASTPGTIVDGKIQYVDSVFYKYNKVLNSIAENEDSLCVALFPSNTAWQEALDKISESFKYKKVYYYTDENSVLCFDTVDVDSIRMTRTVNALLSNMFYSLYEQPSFTQVTGKRPEQANADDVATFFNTTDSLMSTVYYSTNNKYHQYAPECNSLAEGKTPVAASNGFAFVTDHFNFKANKAWKFDLLQEGEDRWMIDVNRSKNCKPEGAIVHTVTDANRNPNISGVVSANKFIEIPGQTATAKAKLVYNLNNVCSGKYDVGVVVVPEGYVDTTIVKSRYNKLKGTIAYDFLDNKGKIKDVTSKTSATIEADPTKVDTLWLFEDFEFPYSFYRLPNAKPYLMLDQDFGPKDKNIVNPNLLIDCIILKSKDE